MIVYFNLKPILLEKLNMRRKNEGKEEEEQKNKQNTEISKKNVVDHSKIIQPKDSLYKDKIKEIEFNPSKKENNSYLLKKRIKKRKNIIINKRIINRLQTSSSSKVLSYKQNILKIELNEEQIYQIFLLIYKYIDYEINSLSYKDAIQLDNRNYFMYYISLIRTQHLLFFSFLPSFDYNSQILKIFLFFLNFTINFTVNALFFNDDTMHKIYIDGGSFNFIYNIPQILYSSLISGLFNSIIRMLALSDSNLIELKNKSNKQNIISKASQVTNRLKVKFVLFFIISFILLVFFWFYLACFCAVYKNTQIHLIKDTLISFGTSMLYPFGIYFLPGIFRIISLKGKNRNFLYNFSKLLQMI